MKRFLYLFCLSLWLQLPTWGQNNIILFGEGSPPLAYTTGTKRAGARLNNYNLFVKLPNRGVAELQIAYPEGIGGIFQEDSIEVIDRGSGKPIPLKEIKIDREGRGVRLLFAETIPGNKQTLIIRLSGVNNPRNSGVYELVVQALGTEANPLFQTIGRWLVDIN